MRSLMLKLHLMNLTSQFIPNQSINKDSSLWNLKESEISKLYINLNLLNSFSEILVYIIYQIIKLMI